MFRSFRRAVASVCVWFIAATGLLAQTGNDVLLTVTQKGQVTMLDMQDLKDIGVASIETSTIWTEGKITFEGVPLIALLDHLNVSDGTIVAKAINDYQITIPVSEARIEGPLIAYSMNGSTMSVRDKGPLWLVYPYDQNDDFRSEVIYARSIWQLDRISFEP